LNHAKKIIIAISIILLASIILTQQIQIYQLNNQIEKINKLKQYLLNHYEASSIEELIQKKLKEYGLHYTGNPFTTALYPGQIQTENITGMHWYTYLSGSLYNRTDVIAFPEQTATFIIFGKDTDGDGIYDIVYAKNCTSGQIQYGGEWDAGGIDGSNASAVINAAINALANGGKIFVRNGIYMITATIKPKVDNLIFEGEGYNTVFKLADDANCDVFDCEQKNIAHPIFRNFRIEGNKENNVAGSGFRFTGYHGIIENLWIQNCPENGFVGEKPSSGSMVDMVFRYIRAVANGGVGFYWGAGSGGSVDDNYFYDIICYDNGGDGAYFASGSSLQLFNLNCYSNKGNGAFVAGSFPRIINGEFTNNHRHGLYLYRSGGYQALLVNVRARNNGKEEQGVYDGIHIDGNGTYTTFVVDLINCYAIDDGSPKYQNYGLNLRYYSSSSRLRIFGGEYDPNYSSPGINIVGGSYSYIEHISAEGYFVDRLIAIFSGDGSSTQFAIAHGMITAPNIVQVTPLTADASGDFYVTTNSTHIIIHYVSAPPSGTDNVKLSISARV